MQQPTWKVAVVLGVCLIGLLTLLPNFFARSTLERLPGFVPKSQIVLGLDLQGGSHLLLEVEGAAVIKDRLEQLAGEIRGSFRTAQIIYRYVVSGETVVLTLGDPSKAAEAEAKLRDLNPMLASATLGDVAQRELLIESDGAGKLTVSLTQAARNQRIANAVTQSIEVVRRRIDELGTRETTVQRQGIDRVLVQVPGERNPENIKRLLGKTARLTFHMVDQESSLEDARAGRLPSSSMLLETAETDGPRQWIVRRQVDISGENLTDAQPSFSHNEPVVSFRLDNAGARKFGRITQENVGKLFAIVLDDKVISAPRIREPILGGSGIISGNFTVQSANELAVLLRAGALPAPLRVIEERSVGPELGADSIRAGAIACIVAVALVVAFMVVYYGTMGVIADLALLFNLVLILGVMSMLGATLTLPGIAGIVLTMGMAVDSNVLIYERIHEEQLVGRTPLAAIDVGFKEALRAIIDANLTTLIAAVVLFQFGTGPVKGFAVTLAIGVLTTMFTAVTVSRLMVDSWYRYARPASLGI